MKNRYILVIVMILVLLIQLGCLTLQDTINYFSQPRYTLVKDNNKPFECNLYTVFPPEGNDWYYYQKGNNIVFLKKYSSYHTLFFIVGPTDFPGKVNTPQEFYDYINKHAFINKNPDRFNNLERIIQRNNRFGAYCVKYCNKSEDHKIPVQTPKGYLILQDDGYIFQYDANNYIHIICSERYDVNENDPKVQEIFTKFINKISLKRNTNAPNKS